MVAIAIQNVNLPLGTSLLVVTVQNVATSSWRKKSVVVASRLFVAKATTRKKRLNKRRGPKVNFRLLLVRT
ncbi:DNA topoisomerase I [Streptococcus pneumoniae]|nr:DNA topoisomerase I [Streptococcus pneumoniae]